MIRTIKYLLTIVILNLGLSSCGQTVQINDNENADSIYSLSISTYNHAEQMIHGILTYDLVKNDLTISKKHTFSDRDIILLEKTIDDNALNQIQNIRLDSLENYYFNACILATSGDEYSVSVSNDTITKTIDLHHFYHKQIETLFNELNKQIPDSLKIRYLTSDTKQDCH